MNSLLQQQQKKKKTRAKDENYCSRSATSIIRIPRLSEEAARSDPARSISDNFPTDIDSVTFLVRSRRSTMIWRIA